MAEPRIRIEAGVMGHTTRVFYRQDSGEEIDIGHCLTGLTVTVKVGEPTKATMEAILVGGDFDAALEKLTLDTIGPSRWGRLWFRVQRRWWRLKYRPRDVTHFGSRAKEYV